MCIPKEERGFDFKDLEVFDQALLEKQVWREDNAKSELSYGSGC